MTSKARVPSLKPIKKSAKPATPLQEAWLASRKKDVKNIKASTNALLHKLQNPAPDPLSEHCPPGEDHAGHAQDWGGPEWGFDGPDPDNFLPAENTRPDNDNHAEQDGIYSPAAQGVIEQLNSAAYQEKRLDEQNRWAQQWERMLGAYLSCKNQTSDWGDQRSWDNDFNTGCNCSITKRQKVVRALDLVDLCRTSFKLLQPQTPKLRIIRPVCLSL